jgi:hypothetical protein
MRTRTVVLVAVAAATATIGGARPTPAQSARPGDTTRPDTSGRRVIRREEAPRRRPPPAPLTRRGRLDDATPSELAAAYRDSRARDVIARARRARFRQDSTLTSYDATVKQRLSAGLNVKAIGAERLAFRSELAARVRWTSSNRIWVDILGARTAVPVAFPGAKVLTGAAEIIPVPYFTGSDRLMWWFNFGDGEADDDDEHPFAYVNPLERGAESVYEYRSGDSALIQLPGAKQITLKEVIIRPHEASPDLIVGSLWFESDGGQLVRAAFRPAAPLNMMKIVGEDSFDDVPAPIRAMMTPFTFDVESFTIDYGLYGGRWWLPRAQTAKGQMRIGFMRSTGTIDQSFRYASVNGTDTLPEIPAGRGRLRSDFGDDVSLMVKGTVDGVVPGNQFRRDEEERGLDCAKGDTLVRRRRDGDLRTTINMPCDTAALLHSPELPPSIFDKGEEHFGLADARALAKDLGVDKELAAVSGSSSSRTTIAYGWRDGLMRYNRVEGLSLGVRGERALGGGYVGSAVARLGSGDLEPNIDASVMRGTPQRSLALGGYHRLDSANDWGDPFGLGGSISSLVFGRDEGFYYRSSGAELTGRRVTSAATSVAWRLFAERQHNAPAETQVSLPNAFRGAEFEPNVKAVGATEGGAAARLRGVHGLDPRGLRLSADVRAEAAAGTFDYARGALDLTASRYLFGNLALALTGGAGTSGGTLSPQRAWHIGGTHTVRGFGPGTLSGDSYWLARAELGLGGSVLRPTAFYDAGWAGPRTAWSQSRGNIRGAGFGVSFLEGLARIDLARGVDPKTVWRAHLYVESSF